MRAEGPNHYPYILGMALNHYEIKPKVSICFRLQPGLENWQFSVNNSALGHYRQNNTLLEYLQFLFNNSKTICIVERK